jgi:hypothetical protein
MKLDYNTMKPKENSFVILGNDSRNETVDILLHNSYNADIDN